MTDDRLPPQDVVIERAILGGMFEFKAAAEWGVGALTPSDFWREGHQGIFLAMQAVFARDGVITPELVTAETNAQGADKHAGGIEYIGALSYSTDIHHDYEYGHGPSAVTAAGKVLRAMASQRELIWQADDIQSFAYDNPHDHAATIAKAQQAIRKIAESSNMDRRATPANETRPSFEAYLQERRARDAGVHGLRFGISTIDEPIGGLQDQLLVLVMGLSGFGKTTLATQAVFASATAHGDGAAGPVLVYMLEDSTEAFWRRWVQWRAGVTDMQLMAGGLDRASVDDEARIAAAVAEMDTVPIRVTDQFIDVAGIESDVRNARMEGPVLGVLVDYAQLIKGGEGDRAERQLTDITYRLVALANECETTVILPSQVTVQQDGETSAKHAKSLGEGATMVVEVERGQSGETLRERKASSKVTVVCGKMREGFQLGAVPVHGDFARRRLSAVTETYDQRSPTPARDEEEDPFGHDDARNR